MRQRVALRAAAAAAALALLFAVAAPARAEINNFGPEGPGAIHCGTKAECDLVQQMINGLTMAANPDKAPAAGMAAMASAPPNVTSAQVARALGTVLAAAALEDKAIATLGDPRKFP